MCVLTKDANSSLIIWFPTSAPPELQAPFWKVGDL